MATEEGNLPIAPAALFAQLADPFHASEIKWRVTHTTQDGSRGAVIAFADPRAYTDRLNQIFTPTGWTRSYTVATVAAVSRFKRDKIIATGKVLVTCTLTIHGLGAHTGGGEEWADEENAMTSAEAQAFKRACTCFELGRYLYNFAEMWVPLNDRRQPLDFPTLPKWALPKLHSKDRQDHSLIGAQTGATQRGPVDQNATAKIEGFRRLLGDRIHGEILWRVARTERADQIPNAQVQMSVMDTMERATRGVYRANVLAETVGDSAFISVLDSLQIGSMTTIASLETLKRLVLKLERLEEQQAA